MRPGEVAPASHSDTLDASLSPESANGAREEAMENACRGAARRLSCVAALILAGPTAAVEPAAGPADPPELALLQFLGETSGLDPELMRFMESREARRAVKDAAKKEAETADPQIAADLQPSGEERLRTQGAARWETMSDTERAAARARFNTWRQSPGGGARGGARALEAVPRTHARPTGGGARGVSRVPRAAARAPRGNARTLAGDVARGTPARAPAPPGSQAGFGRQAALPAMLRTRIPRAPVGG